MYIAVNSLSNAEAPKELLVNFQNVAAIEPADIGCTLRMAGGAQDIHIQENMKELQELIEEKDAAMDPIEAIENLGIDDIEDIEDIEDFEDYDGDIFLLKFGKTIFSLEQIATDTMVAFVQDGETREMISEPMPVTTDNVVATIQSLAVQLAESIQVDDVEVKPHLRILKKEDSKPKN